MLKNARAVLWVTAAVLLTMLLGSRFYGWERAVTVTAVHAECKPIYNSVTASGSVEAARSYAFSARSDAVVGEVFCGLGETVHAGQALWRLEPAGEVRWTAELLQNAVSVLTGSGESERVVSDAAGGGVLVCAPADCTLLAVPSKGQPAPAGLPYAQAAELGSLRLRVDIAESFVADVQAGQSANITVQATGGRYAGRVQSVAPVARQAVSLTGTAGAVTVSALLSVEGADGALRPGYSATAKIFVDEKPSAVVLPYEAIRQEGESEYVYVIGGDGRAHRRAVQTGYALSSAVEVESGVAAGEAVVTGNPDGLCDGVLVEVSP